MTKSKAKALEATRVVLEQLIKLKCEDREIKEKIEDLACELDALIKVYVK